MSETSGDLAVYASLSIWDPIHLGVDEVGTQVSVSLFERNILVGGEPGGGKSGALNLIVAHAALVCGLPPGDVRCQAGRAGSVGCLCGSGRLRPEQHEGSAGQAR